MKREKTTWRGQEGRVLPFFLLWLLGVPASLLFIFYLIGFGR